jgi:hypothetical protein
MRTGPSSKRTNTVCALRLRSNPNPKICTHSQPAKKQCETPAERRQQYDTDERGACGVKSSTIRVCVRCGSCQTNSSPNQCSLPILMRATVSSIVPTVKPNAPVTVEVKRGPMRFAEAAMQRANGQADQLDMLRGGLRCRTSHVGV